MVHFLNRKSDILLKYDDKLDSVAKVEISEVDMKIALKVDRK